MIQILQIRGENIIIKCKAAFHRLSLNSGSESELYSMTIRLTTNQVVHKHDNRFIVRFEAKCTSIPCFSAPVELHYLGCFKSFSTGNIFGTLDNDLTNRKCVELCSSKVPIN